MSAASRAQNGPILCRAAPAIAREPRRSRVVRSPTRQTLTWRHWQCSSCVPEPTGDTHETPPVTFAATVRPSSTGVQAAPAATGSATLAIMLAGSVNGVPPGRSDLSRAVVVALTRRKLSGHTKETFWRAVVAVLLVGTASARSPPPARVHAVCTRGFRAALFLPNLEPSHWIAKRKTRTSGPCISQGRPMIQRVVRAVLRMPAFVLLLAAGILGIGLYCYKQLDIEAYPNPVPPMIEIITQPNGWSAEEVERYVTVPLENRAERDDRPRPHPVAVAVRPVGREMLLHLGRRVPPRPAEGPQSTELRDLAPRRDAAAVAVERDR